MFHAVALLPVDADEDKVLCDLWDESFRSLGPHHETRDFEILKDHPDVSSLVSDAYRILRIMAADGESQELIDRIDLGRAKFEEGCNVFGPMSAAEELAVEQLRGAAVAIHVPFVVHELMGDGALEVVTVRDTAQNTVVELPCTRLIAALERMRL